MSDILQNLIFDLRRSKPSFVPRLSEQDIVSVWDNASELIEKHMIHRKGVAIQGLGVFSFAVKTIDIGNNRSISLQRPVFLLSEKFSGTHCIKYPKQHTPGQIPVMSLNYTILSNDSPFDRDTVEMCVKEILHALSHAVNSGRTVEFPFLGIGKLVVCDGKAKMKFFREFLFQLDCSGQIEGAFNQRSTTTMSGGRLRSEASVISSSYSSSSRPGTVGSSVVLPRIVGPSNSNSLDLVTSSVGTLGVFSLSPKKTAMPRIAELTCEEEEEEEEEEEDTKTECDFSPSPGTPESEAPTTRSEEPQREIRTRESAGDTLTTLSRDDSLKSYLISEDSEQMSPRPLTCSHLGATRHKQCYICHQRAVRNVPVTFTEERKHMELVEDKLLQDYLQRKDMLEIAKEQVAKIRHRDHSKKVAAFNLSIADSKNTEKSAKDMDFHSSYVFQHRSVTPPHNSKHAKYCSQLDQQVKRKVAHHKAAKNTEEEKDKLEKLLVVKELERDKRDFISRKNTQKNEYQEALAEQVNIRNQMLASNFRHPNTAPPLSQECADSKGSSGSADDASPGKATGETSPMFWPSSQRQHHLRPLSLPKPTIILPFSHCKPMIVEDGEKLKTVRFKTSPPSSWQSDAVQPIFGVHDMTPEKLQDRKQIAKQLLKEQLEMVQQKQYLTSIMAKRSKEEETDMLKKTKQDLVEEYQVKRRHRHSVRESLDDSWRQNISIKHDKESLEKQQAEEPSILLHQQCEKYKRCRQCKRDVDNTGGSNLLTESRFISGAKLMV